LARFSPQAHHWQPTSDWIHAEPRHGGTHNRENTDMGLQ
jgi:hypothetical protein